MVKCVPDHERQAVDQIKMRLGMKQVEFNKCVSVRKTHYSVDSSGLFYSFWYEQWLRDVTVHW